MALLSDSIAILRYGRIDLASQEFVPSATPAVGQPYSFKIPGDRLYILKTVRCIFTTSATVGNRIPEVLVQDPQGNTVYASPTNFQVTASLAVALNWTGEAATAYNVGTIGVQALPSIAIEPGYTLVLTATLMQAGDAFSGISIVAISIPTGPAIDAGVPPIVHPVAIPVTGLAA